MTEKPPPSPTRDRNGLWLRKLLFISITFAVISFILSAVELGLINDYLMKHSSWTPIPDAGLLWIASLVLLFLSILFGIYMIFAERQAK